VLAEANLAVATALNPVLGYTGVESIVREAARSGRTTRDVAIESGVARDVVDRYLDLDRIVRGEAPPAP
jgi:fumarate hydratase class II